MGTMIGRRKKKEGGKAPLLMIVSIIVRWVSFPLGCEIITFLNRIIESTKTKISVFLVRIVWAFPIVKRTMKMFFRHFYSPLKRFKFIFATRDLVVLGNEARNVDKISACHIIGKVNATVNTCKGSVLFVLSPLTHMSHNGIEKKLRGEVIVFDTILLKQT
jgi:hypothetical protein